jgi:hypothetical protein
MGFRKPRITEQLPDTTSFLPFLNSVYPVYCEMTISHLDRKDNIYLPVLSTVLALQPRLPVLFLNVSENYSKYFIEVRACYSNKLNGKIKRDINKHI